MRPFIVVLQRSHKNMSIEFFSWDLRVAIYAGVIISSNRELLCGVITLVGGSKGAASSTGISYVTLLCLHRHAPIHANLHVVPKK